MYEVHIPNPSCTLTQRLISFSTRDMAWLFVEQYYEDHGLSNLLLVRTPDKDWDIEPLHLIRAIAQQKFPVLT